MSWLARLKNVNNLEKNASETTETLFVVSVAPTSALIEKNKDAIATNIPVHASPSSDIRPVKPNHLTPTLLKASLPIDALRDKVGTWGDIDTYCWPHSTAMNRIEIATFTARLSRFSNFGVILADGEKLANKMVIRDRVSDQRRLCLECKHLFGYGAGSWHCTNLKNAGIAIQKQDAQLPTDLVLTLQNCSGFKYTR